MQLGTISIKFEAYKKGGKVLAVLITITTLKKP